MKQLNFQKFPTLTSEIQQTVDVSRITKEVFWVTDRMVFKKKSVKEHMEEHPLYI